MSFQQRILFEGGTKLVDDIWPIHYRHFCDPSLVLIFKTNLGGHLDSQKSPIVRIDTKKSKYTQSENLLNRWVQRVKSNQ